MRARRTAAFGIVPYAGEPGKKSSDANSDAEIMNAPTRPALGGGAAAAHPDPRLHERAEQPGPDSPLMVRAVPGRRAALIAGGVASLARGERAQPERREQSLLDRVHDLARRRAVQHRER